MMAPVRSSHGALIVLLLIFGLLAMAAAENNEESWKQTWLYFQKVDLQCESGTIDIQSVQFWIFPSGEIRRPADDSADHHVTLINDGFGLSIDKLDDPDFGIYYCIVKTGPNVTDVIKIGINVDGPHYGDELIARYKKNAIIGGIAAGVMLLVIVTIWVLYSNITCCRDNPDNAEATRTYANVPNGHAAQEANIKQAPDKLDGWQQASKIDESIYDSADALKSVPAMQYRGVVGLPQTVGLVGLPQAVGRHDDRLLSSDSGHYQTIGSLERDERLLSESEIHDDVKILKTVIRRDWSETDDPKVNNSHENESLENDGQEKSLDVSVDLSEADQQTRGADTDLNSTMNSIEDAEEEVEYSVSSKMRPQYKETVVVIDGDVILEPNGTSVTVTSVQSVNPTHSLPKDSIVSLPSLSEYDGFVDKMIETGMIPTVPSVDEGREVLEPVIQEISITNTSKPSDINKDGSGNDSYRPLKDLRDAPKAEDEDTRKISTASTPKSETDSNQSSTVDECTVEKYQNVLASLMSKHSRSNSGSAASGRGMGSRSTSADSNVFQDDVIAAGGAKHADVRL